MKRDVNIPATTVRDLAIIFEKAGSVMQAMEQRIGELEAELAQTRELVPWPPEAA